VYALLPTLCVGEPFQAWALMGVFALVALASGEGTGRFFPVLALIIGLAGSIHAYQHNRRVIAGMREIWRQSEMRRRQLIQPAETNGLGRASTNLVEAAQTNRESQREPELSPFNCCP
jgi:hypothetical protein